MYSEKIARPLIYPHVMGTYHQCGYMGHALMLLVDCLDLAVYYSMLPLRRWLTSPSN